MCNSNVTAANHVGHKLQKYILNLTGQRKLSKGNRIKILSLTPIDYIEPMYVYYTCRDPQQPSPSSVKNWCIVHLISISDGSEDWECPPATVQTPVLLLKQQYALMRRTWLLHGMGNSFTYKICFIIFTFKKSVILFIYFKFTPL